MTFLSRQLVDVPLPIERGVTNVLLWPPRARLLPVFRLGAERRLNNMPRNDLLPFSAQVRHELTVIPIDVLLF